jgi:hypothetical protein
MMWTIFGHLIKLFAAVHQFDVIAILHAAPCTECNAHTFAT